MGCDQEASLSWSELEVTERVLYLGSNLGRLRDFSISIWIWGRRRGFFILIWVGGDRELYLAQLENLEFLCNRQKFILDLNDREPNLLNRFIFFEDLCSGDLSFFFFFWNFVRGDISFWRFVQGIFLSLKICLEDFSLWWFIQEIFLMNICSRDFSFWIIFQEIFPFIKMCSWRFVFWRFVQEIYPFEILLGNFYFENWKSANFSFWFPARKTRADF